MNTNTLDAIGNELAASKDQFAEELRKVVKEAEALLHASAEQTGDGAAAARARIQQSLHALKGRLLEAEESVVTHTKHAAKATDQYVHENPWKAIGISACVGAIIGMLIARR
jgi:ElaB/YqjD/DUF883 family membrane-anchored ribosome-binding protein